MSVASWEDVVALIDAWQAPPLKRGPYKNRGVLMRPEPSLALRYGCLAAFVIAMGLISAFVVYWPMAHPNKWPGWHCRMRSGYCYRIPPNSK